MELKSVTQSELHEMTERLENCEFCGKEFDFRGLKNHERYCEKNPNRASGRPQSRKREQDQEVDVSGILALLLPSGIPASKIETALEWVDLTRKLLK